MNNDTSSTSLSPIYSTFDLARLPSARYTIPIDAVAINPTELLAAAPLLPADPTSGFGVAKPPPITVDGQIDLQERGTLQGAARAWSERHGLSNYLKVITAGHASLRLRPRR